MRSITASPAARWPRWCGTGAVPDADIRAMATYLASLAGAAPADAEAVAARAQARADAVPVGVEPAGARLYEGACAVCHDADAPAGFGARPALALNTNVHARTPDNLIRVVLNDGIATPAHADLGAMPGFAGGCDPGGGSAALRPGALRPRRPRLDPDRGERRQDKAVGRAVLGGARRSA